MKIEGSIRSNLLSAIVSSRRLRGQRVHSDTVAYWQAILAQGRRADAGPFRSDVSDLLDELALELTHFIQKSGDTSHKSVTAPQP